VRGCCGTGRGAARAVLSCAGAYISGAAGSNECPAGSVRIETQAACRTAAIAAGKTIPSTFVETTPAYPRGCYYTSSSNAYFNTHAVGAGRSSRQLLCAALASTAGAPPPQRRRCVQRHCACLHRRACVPALRVYCAVCIIIIQMAYI
jgi:hypothetical protein